MTRTALLKLATTGLIAAIGFGVPTTIVVASDGDQPRANPSRAANSAQNAQRQLERGRTERAVGYAEQAVALAPDNANHRALLGQTYMAAGRFESAEASFSAARELGATDSRTIIGHALSLVAVNRASEALSLLDANADTLPASDYGLALAVSGQAERGAMVLTDVVRSGESTARDRQNLALAYAFAGRWLEARLLAAQDLGAARVGERIEQWAAMTQAAQPNVRIAGLIGTSPVQDPGMPIRLALNSTTVQSYAAVAVDPAPLATYAPPPPSNSAELVETMLADARDDREVATAADHEAPGRVAIASVPLVDSAVGGVEFYSNPVIQPLRSMVAMVAPLRNPSRAAPVTTTRNGRPARVAGANLPAAAVAAAPAAALPAPAVAAVPRAVASGPVRTSGWVVQLGAFATTAIARERWASLASRHAALSARDGVSTSATVNGRTFHRLNATGFNSRAEAASACASVTQGGGTCFVRTLPAGERVQWASRPINTRVASR